MKRRLSLLWILLVLGPAVFAQAQSAGSIEVTCIKARDGKLGELRSYLMETSAKVGKYRVDSGHLSSYAISEAVAPAGRSAPCDFHIVHGFSGAPKQALAMTDETLKRAGVSHTAAQGSAKRNEVSYLVSRQYWRVHDVVGTLVKGGYVRLNYFKTNPGAQAEWLRMERSGWKQMAEVWAKETAGRAWRLHTMAMPGGTNLPYNALTVDGFPNWDDLFTGGNPRNTWVKVHPDSDYSGYMNQVGRLAERPMVSTMRLIELIRK